MGEGRRACKVRSKLRGPVQGFPAGRLLRRGDSTPRSPRRAANARGPRSATHPASRTAAPVRVPPIAAAPAARTPELPTPFSTFHSIPPPVTSFRKQKPPGPALKRPRTSWPLKGPPWPREGRGLGTAAQPLCGRPTLAFSGSLPPAAPRHRPGLVRSLRSGQIPSSHQGRGG